MYRIDKDTSPPTSTPTLTSSTPSAPAPGCPCSTLRTQAALSGGLGNRTSGLPSPPSLSSGRWGTWTYGRPSAARRPSAAPPPLQDTGAAQGAVGGERLRSLEGLWGSLGAQSQGPHGKVRLLILHSHGPCLQVWLQLLHGHDRHQPTRPMFKHRMLVISTPKHNNIIIIEMIAAYVVISWGPKSSPESMSYMVL